MATPVSHTSALRSSLYVTGEQVNRAVHAAARGTLRVDDPALFHLFVGGGSDNPLLVAMLQALANDVHTFQSREPGECCEEYESEWLYKLAMRLEVAVALARDVCDRAGVELEEVEETG